MSLYIYNPQQYIKLLLDNIQYMPIVGSRKSLGARLAVGENYIKTYAWRIDFEKNKANKLTAYIDTKNILARRYIVVTLNHRSAEHLPLNELSPAIIQHILQDINSAYRIHSELIDFPVGQIKAYPKINLSGTIIGNKRYCLESLWYQYSDFLKEDRQKLWNYYLIYTVDNKAIKEVINELSKKLNKNIENFTRRARGGLLIDQEYPWIAFSITRLARKAMLNGGIEKAYIEEYIGPIKAYLKTSKSLRNEAHEDYNGILNWYYD